MFRHMNISNLAIKHTDVLPTPERIRRLVRLFLFICIAGAPRLSLAAFTPSCEDLVKRFLDEQNIAETRRLALEDLKSIQRLARHEGEVRA